MKIKNKKISWKVTVVIFCGMFLSLASYAQSSWNDYAVAREILSEEELKLQIGFLSDSICQGRGIGTRGGVEAASWVAREFSKAGLTKMGNTWYRPFIAQNGQIGKNVIGMIPGTRVGSHNKYVIVGAHFDHLGILNDKLYPGADANASGTVAMINIAKMLLAIKNTGKIWESNVIFVGFDGKEADMAGSKALWNSIIEGNLTDPITGQPITKRQIELMVNIDQIGSSLSPLWSKRKDYIIMLGNDTIKSSKRDQLYLCNRLYITNLDLGFDYYGSENFTRMFYRLSDQRVFVDNGIPAVLFTSGITMKTNKTHDNAESLDYKVFLKRILLMFHWIERML